MNIESIALKHVLNSLKSFAGINNANVIK